VTTHRTTVTLERGDDAPRRARDAVQRALHEVGAGYDPAEVVLLVSELVTNAVVHTRSEEVRLTLSVDRQRLRCVVADQAAQLMPAMRTNAPTEVGGLGLVIVDAVASRWGVDEDGDSKSVWFEMDADDA
jgi:anti-sigma regulatory factor (Ser/Thr protein kinase)